MTTRKQAPMLFGKRMRQARYGVWRRAIRGIGCVDIESDAGLFVGRVDFDRVTNWKRTAQAAANDAERYLRRLHRALGKVIGV